MIYSPLNLQQYSVRTVIEKLIEDAACKVLYDYDSHVCYRWMIFLRNQIINWMPNQYGILFNISDHSSYMYSYICYRSSLLNFQLFCQLLFTLNKAWKV